MALGVPDLALSAHSHILLLELMEGQAKVLYCSRQALTVDRARDLDRIHQALKVDLVKDDDRSPALMDFYRNLQALDRRIDRVDLVDNSRYRSRTPAEVLVLFYIPLPSCQRSHLLQLAPLEYLLFRSHPSLSLGLDHNLCLWALP